MKITIIGAGPGGYETAVAAAARGIEEAAVTLLDHSDPGIVALAQRILSAVRELEE